ncbi:MAG: phospholipase D family protein [Sediminibacterium sp.]|jgi:HKD family nuclease|uniref:phospholipase D family protein n=1 Tax=Sediminibacterium sp. TaxID=1917865 RepID=UPI002AB94935|nr:phospholipase D family protein [Sediminibacterium sp.]MDZ4072860.1 phospholipase D family protein [Sediminibacterium sp.]
MKITILGQGFEKESENSVGNYLMKFLKDKNFHSFYAITAFTSFAGVTGIQKHLENGKHLKNVTIITGVDQKGTSEEALRALLKLNINSYVFFVPPPSPIFHPKIYLFEGQKKSELIIGSSNLTVNGLFTNLEASILLSISNQKVSDKKTLERLKQYFTGLFDYSDPNLKPLTNELITDLVNAKIVPTETERKELQDKREDSDTVDTKAILSKIFPKRTSAKIPRDFRSIKKDIIKKSVPPSILKGLTLLWESGPLTERDLNIPKGPNTNPTGSMLFKKGRTDAIDQRHYFRDVVFASLKWVFDTRKGSSHLEKAAGLFRLEVLGKDYGTFALTLTHNPKTDTQSYFQKNSMTSISWGDAKPIIAKKKLIGRSAKLYRSFPNNGEYVLIIS